MADNCDNITDGEAQEDFVFQSTEEVTPEVAERLASVFGTKQNVNIVVAGKTGVGKSTLIGSLLPNVVAQVNVKQGPVPADHQILERYEGKIGEGFVTVYDTRGYCSITGSKKNAKLLVQELKRNLVPSQGKHSTSSFFAKRCSSDSTKRA